MDNKYANLPGIVRDNFKHYKYIRFTHLYYILRLEMSLMSTRQQM